MPIGNEKFIRAKEGGRQAVLETMLQTMCIILTI